MEPTINRKCDFSQVEKTFAEYPCTPVLTREHEDVIRINAPEEVVFIPHGERALREDTKFIVCATMRMRTETLAKLGMHGNEEDSVMFVAVDAKSNKTYSGPIAQLGTSIPMPARPPRLPESVYRRDVIARAGRRARAGGQRPRVAGLRAGRRDRRAASPLVGAETLDLPARHPAVRR